MFCTMQGGLGTREEMCLSFPVYYPRTTLSTCTSTPRYAELLNYVIETFP